MPAILAARSTDAAEPTNTTAMTKLLIALVVLVSSCIMLGGEDGRHCDVGEYVLDGRYRYEP